MLENCGKSIEWLSWSFDTLLSQNVCNKMVLFPSFSLFLTFSLCFLYFLSKEFLILILDFSNKISFPINHLLNWHRIPLKKMLWFSLLWSFIQFESNAIQSSSKLTPFLMDEHIVLVVNGGLQLRKINDSVIESINQFQYNYQ